jgi:hypothetical protein
MELSWTKIATTARWLPAYLWQRATRRPFSGRSPLHLIIALADHFEPAIMRNKPGAYATRDVQEQRLKKWCSEYPAVVDQWRDSDGRPFCHTYFYPAEQYDKELIDMLAEHCRAGWGEIEIHLHHGIEAPDTAENTRRVLVTFRDRLVEHGCLSRADGSSLARYAFVHGNFTLANSGRGFCGVDEEIQILADTGCFADFTLPSAPTPAQVAKINSLYECALPLTRRAPHRRGRDLRRGRPPRNFPLIMQGPLLLSFARQNGHGFLPYIENSAVSSHTPPTMVRLRLWQRARIIVQGRPDWLFIKLHCHGMDPREHEAMLGGRMRKFLQDLKEGSEGGGRYQTHFVTAREMVNIALAACDGRHGNPGDFRDYRFRLIRPRGQ